MRAAVCAGAGFLLAVLWFDLMFDVQIRRGEGALDSIAAYYARVTTGARPMNRLIAVAMVATLGLIVAEIVRGVGAAWMPWTSLVAAVPPITLAGARTVPRAVRLGTRADTLERQSSMARSILADHVFCFASIATVVVVQLFPTHV